MKAHSIFVMLSFSVLLGLAVCKVKQDKAVADGINRMALALENISRVQTYTLSNVEKFGEPHRRRRLTKDEDRKIMSTPFCIENAYVGYDDNIHPEECR